MLPLNVHETVDVALNLTCVTSNHMLLLHEHETVDETHNLNCVRCIYDSLIMERFRTTLVYTAVRG